MAARFFCGLGASRRMPAMVSDTSAVSVGEGRPAARCRKRIAAARSFKVLPAWPASRPAARKAATSLGEAGRGGTLCWSHQMHQARTAER